MRGVKIECAENQFWTENGVLNLSSFKDIAASHLLKLESIQVSLFSSSNALPPMALINRQPYWPTKCFSTQLWIDRNIVSKKKRFHVINALCDMVCRSHHCLGLVFFFCSEIKLQSWEWISLKKQFLCTLCNYILKCSHNSLKTQQASSPPIFLNWINIYLPLES